MILQIHWIALLSQEFREYKEEMEKKATEASFEGPEGGQRTSPGVTEEEQKLESLI